MAPLEISAISLVLLDKSDPRASAKLPVDGEDTRISLFVIIHESFDDQLVSVVRPNHSQSVRLTQSPLTRQRPGVDKIDACASRVSDARPAWVIIGGYPRPWSSGLMLELAYFGDPQLCRLAPDLWN